MVTYPAFLYDPALDALDATQDASWLWVRPGDRAERFVGTRIYDASGRVWTVDQAIRTEAHAPRTTRGLRVVEVSVSKTSLIPLPDFADFVCRIVETDTGWWEDRPDVSSAAGFCRLVRECRSHRDIINTLDAMW